MLIHKKFILKLAPIATVAGLIMTGILLPSPNDKPTVEGETIRVSAEASGEGTETEIDPRVPADMVGFDWSGHEPASIQVRALKDEGWTEWQTLEGNPSEGPDLDSPEYNGRTSTPPLWFGDGAKAVRLKVEEGNVSDLKLHVVRSDVASTGGSMPSASAHPPQPRTISRAEWGADESWRTCTPNVADQVRYSIVHHTATSNDYSPAESAAIMRSIYHFHVFSRGFCDIGYNFLIDRFGNVFEGRFGGTDKAVQGAHASGFNFRSTGVSVIGNFVDASLPSAAYQALRQLLSWKLGLHDVRADQQVPVVAGAGSKFAEGETVWLWTISGHKDVDATACPGRIHDLLPGLRGDVNFDLASSIVFYGSFWENLGAPTGGLASGPDVSSWLPGRLDVFFRGVDQQLWHRWHDGGWSHWEGLGGIMKGDPGVVSWGPGRVDVFVRGIDDALYHRWFDGGGWSPWENLGGVLTSGPDVASWSSGRLDVFARGTDNQLWHKWYEGGWSHWEPLGGVLSADPAAASWGHNRLDVFARGTDNALWHRWWDGFGWSHWEGLGGILDSSPDVSTWGPGRLDVFVEGNESEGFHLLFEGGWKHFDGIGGVLTAAPGAASWAPGRIDVFVRGTDNVMFHKWRG